MLVVKKNFFAYILDTPYCTAPLQMDWQEVGVLKRLLPELACQDCQVKLENSGGEDDVGWSAM